MGKSHAFADAGTAFHFYRITPKGRAAARERGYLRSAYLADLLELMETGGRSMLECELRQFMPPASLQASIGALLQLGLIEGEE